MSLLIQICLLLLGFVLLVKGADFFVDGSSSVAKRLKVPSLILGLTIVAMGILCALAVFSYLPRSPVKMTLPLPMRSARTSSTSWSSAACVPYSVR